MARRKSSKKVYVRGHYRNYKRKSSFDLKISEVLPWLGGLGSIMALAYLYEQGLMAWLLIVPAAWAIYLIVRYYNNLKTQTTVLGTLLFKLKHFHPSSRYVQEEPYQMELYYYLKSELAPHTQIEVQKGSSRPDIVVADVAIEVKGPTYHKDLQTIPDKCIRYRQHFRHMIVVLFDVKVNDRMYGEWYAGMQRNFPTVAIIRIG